MKIDAKRERDYGKAALDYVRKNGLYQLPTIKPKTPEWNAWRQYFLEHLGFLPYIMQRIEDGIGNNDMTVPADLPEQFDSSYRSAIDLAERLRERL